jgi:protein subunit release factor B
MALKEDLCTNKKKGSSLAEGQLIIRCGMGSLSKAKEEVLRKRMEELQLREEDIDEKFIRSSGKGGQKVNKSSTCVYLKHRPTGIEVKCQKERSQALNRFLARRILANKVEALRLGRLSEERKRIEKIRRQKRKRSRRAKEKILKEKRRKGQEKRTRTYRPLSEELTE